MALVTFMSDFGTEDHYVAAVKAAILRIKKDINIIDISHQIAPSDLEHASYVLKSVFREFPKGTVHLCAIDLSGKEPSDLIVVLLEGHYFVGYDCGLFSLISKQQPSDIILLNVVNKVESTFYAKDVLAPVAAAIASDLEIDDLGLRREDINRRIPRQLKVTKREICGNIIRIDRYGNLITNIEKSEFDTICKINGNTGYEISFGKETSTNINENYCEVESGEYFIIFNSNGLLEIGINKGNAAELFGLKHDYPVNINFQI